jgi:DNA-binding XRE family transcriptional regulator
MQVRGFGREQNGRATPTFRRIARAQRVWMGKTIQDVASVCGVTYAALIQVEQGVAQPSGWLVARLCRVLELDATFALGLKAQQDWSDREQDCWAAVLIYEARPVVYDLEDWA